MTSNYDVAKAFSQGRKRTAKNMFTDGKTVEEIKEQNKFVEGI